MPIINLSQEEKTFIKPLEKSFSTNAGHSITLDYLLSKWQRLAEELEDRYRLEYEDYLNDLDGRHLLEKIITSVPNNLAQKINLIVAPIDEKFKRVTSEDKRNLVPFGFKQKGGWWYTRIPREWSKAETE